MKANAAEYDVAWAEKYFWPKVDIRNPHACWPWKNTRVRAGYGRIFIGEQAHRAHRVALTLSDGSSAKLALHHCDNRLCCNPLHLYWGDDQDNMSDAIGRGRWKPLCGVDSPTFLDRSGRRYGRWTAIRPDHFKINGAYWLCRCECGRTRTISGKSLQGGNSARCECALLATLDGAAGGSAKESNT